jgi:hypothetical protein
MNGSDNEQHVVEPQINEPPEVARRLVSLPALAGGYRRREPDL